MYNFRMYKNKKFSKLVILLIFIALIMFFIYVAFMSFSEEDVFIPLFQPVYCSSAVDCGVVSNTDFQCINSQCVIATCAPAFCNDDGLVSNGCEIACASQMILPLDLTGTFAPATTLNILGQTMVNFVPSVGNLQYGVYTFTYTEEGIEKAKYTIDTSDINFQKGAIDVYDALHNFYVVSDGGAKKSVNGVVKSPLQVAQMTSSFDFVSQLDGNVLKLSLAQTIPTNTGLQTSGLNYFIELQGKTMIIRTYEQSPINSKANNFYSGWTSNCAVGVVDPQSFEMSYLPEVPITRTGSVGNEVFYSTYIDYTRSGSNAQISKIFGLGSCGTGTFRNSYDTSYVTRQPNPITGVTPVLPFEETFYITVSSDVKDVVLAVHEPINPSRAVVNNKVFLDYWTTDTTSQLSGTTSYEKTASKLQILKNYGLDNLAISYHFYAHRGRDCLYPDTSPANPSLVFGSSSILFGGTSAMSVLANTAFLLGYLFGVDMTFDMGQDADLTNPYASELPINYAKNPAGNFILAWNNPNCVTAPNGYSIKTNKRLFYAMSELSDYILDGPFTSLFVDVYTAKSFAGSVDYDYTNDYGSTLKQVYLNLKLLLDFQKNKYGFDGPLFGEGHKNAYSSRNYFAGIVDSTEAEITNGENANVIPNYELEQVKPHQANQGMGYGGRWVADSILPWQVNYLHPDDVWTTFPNGKQNIDFSKQYATALAFGHMGMLETTTYGANNIVGSANYVGVPSPTLKDFNRRFIIGYYTFAAVQPLYLDYEVNSILYWNGVSFIDLNTALKQSNFDFYNVQLKINYASGLEIYINRHQTQNWEVNVNGVNYILPPNGWVYHRAPDLIGYSALFDANGLSSASGTRVDYVKSSDYVYFYPHRAINSFVGIDGTTVAGDKIIVQKSNGWQLDEQIGNSFVITASTTSQLPNSPSGLTATL